MKDRIAAHSKTRPVTERLRRLRRLIKDSGLDALLVSQPENRRYLSGFTGSAGWLFIAKKTAVLTTDFRYVEQARAESPDFEILRTARELRDWLPNLVSASGWRRLGFEASVVSYDSHHKLGEALGGGQVELVPTTNLVEQLRAVKEPEEVRFITEAVKLADAVLEQARKEIRPGITEREAAWTIERLLRQNGSEAVPFEIIVASGPNAALPHARPTDRMIGRGEPVIIDMGARLNGYCSDLSRTLFAGKADATFEKVYDIVLRAQTKAIEGVESGMDAAQADQLARGIIEEAGYGDAFGHGLGHGVGLAVHESPTVGPGSSGSLADGMVFTVEPGIYLVGQGGVRIEDVVVLEEGRARVLTGARKERP
jgi:Xaa-Pro aminopeptidase